MAKEIERKFLVNDSSYMELAERVLHIAQAYISVDPDMVVRLRLADDRAYITIKTRNVGATRNEWEYEIPAGDAAEMMRCCTSGLVEKYRYIVDYAGYTWEVDRFVGAHEGLVLAEIELPSEDAVFDRPPFIGLEVTGDPKYYNSNLAQIKPV